VIQADETSPRGERNVPDGELELSSGFEFNSSSSLGSTLYVAYTVQINRVTGNAVVEILAFVPKDSVVAPQGATHLRFVTAGVSALSKCNRPKNKEIETTVYMLFFIFILSSSCL